MKESEAPKDEEKERVFSKEEKKELEKAPTAAVVCASLTLLPIVLGSMNIPLFLLLPT